MDGEGQGVSLVSSRGVVGGWLCGLHACICSGAWLCTIIDVLELGVWMVRFRGSTGTDSAAVFSLQICMLASC